MYRFFFAPTVHPPERPAALVQDTEQNRHFSLQKGDCHDRIRVIYYFCFQFARFNNIQKGIY